MQEVVTLAVLLLLGGSAAGQESSSLPVRYNVTTLQGDGQLCPSADQRDGVRANISQAIRSVISFSVLPVIQPCECGGPGWTRIAYLNMTDPTQQCPSTWRLNTNPRSCGRITSVGCDSTNFSVGGLQYSQVCGRIIGYQFGHGDAFHPTTDSIDSYYVEGVSVTHGSPRQHVWSFAGANDEVSTNTLVCPCTNINNPTTNFGIPDFVGNDYFCETGVPPGTSFTSGQFYPDDPLWDGDGCGPTSTCCTFNNPPWFCKQLPQPTTDDMEVRICANKATEDTPITLIEIYVK